LWFPSSHRGTSGRTRRRTCSTAHVVLDKPSSVTLNRTRRG
jgi:hypothetical protein